MLVQIVTGITLGLISVSIAWLKVKLEKQFKRTKTIHGLVNSRLTTALLELAITKHQLSIISGDVEGQIASLSEINQLERKLREDAKDQ